MQALPSQGAAGSDAMDEALWNALRATQEREGLLRSMADIHRRMGRGGEVARLESEAEALALHVAQLQRMPPAYTASPAWCRRCRMPAE